MSKHEGESRRHIVVYVAGPYRGKCPNDTENNIIAARAVAEQVWQAGFTALCPHMNSAHMDGLIDDDGFLEGGLELLKRCDVILLSGAWTLSEGCRREHVYAERHKIPMAFSVGALDAHEGAYTWAGAAQGPRQGPGR